MSVSKMTLLHHLRPRRRCADYRYPAELMEMLVRYRLEVLERVDDLHEMLWLCLRLSISHTGFSLHSTSLCQQKES